MGFGLSYGYYTGLGEVYLRKATIEELLKVRIRWGKLEAGGVCVVFSIIASILEKG